VLNNGRTELDHCDLCRGNFLDAGEAGVAFGDWAEPGYWVQEHCAAPKGRTTLECPACDRGLEAFDVSWGPEHVEVDVCMGCKGIWLDADEGGRLSHIVGIHDEAKLQAETQPSVKSYFFQLLTGFPIEVWNPVRRKPMLVYTLLVILAAVYAGQLLAFEQMVETFALVPAEVSRGANLWSVLTHAFLHIGVVHLLGNLYFLYIFGDNVEDRFGRGRFLFLYLIAALAGAAWHLAADPQSNIPMLGASGAVSGLMGAYLTLFPRVRVWVVFFFVRFQLSIYWYLGIWVTFQVSMAALGVPGVAWYAHLGGFLAGVLVTLPMRKQLLAGHPGVATSL